ncbi:hypothetical protein [Bifidobacterium olomucense]|uniref:Uncharacterized protein n=1 Tax=Bifidobacterium olomucense TaxID=2675324 RepID=A0A7Y0EXC2_9BIFI|nr:hypothetical protein [Bifidobacterium sp. DSM 109959]NMM98114.1 hypothetical protein [Bifidobacterium sp. DSM 109959]
MANTEEMRIFAKFSADLWSNEKFCLFADRNPRAAIVWIKSITFAACKKTDGFIGEYAMRHALGASKRDIRLLVENNFLEAGENGWIIHDYLSSQFASSKIDEMAERRREAARRAGIASARARAEKNSVENRSTDVATDVQRTFNEPLNGNPTNVQRQVNGMGNDFSTENQLDIDIDNINYSFTPPTPSRPDFDKLADDLEAIYPVNRFDGKTSQTRFQLEADWPKIVKAAGGLDPVEFLLGKVRDYVAATDAQYVKTFSRFLGGELYTRNWEKPKPSKPTPRPNGPVKSRSQQNLEANMANTWKYMTPEERAKFQNGGVFDAQQG